MSLLKARAEARAEYSNQGICTDMKEMIPKPNLKT
jgi:hypothetical protein